MSATTVHSFILIDSKLWTELIIQTCYPVLAITRKFSKSERAGIFSKNMFFVPKKAGAQLQYVSSNFANFQKDCLKTVEEVDYTNLSSSISHNPKIF